MTDGKHVWAFFGSRGLHCFDMQGNLLWSKDFGQMKIVMSFGEGASPVLCGDKIVVNWDHEGDCFTAAVDATTGKEIWRMPHEERSSWATPLVVEVNGKKQVITAATNKIRALDPETGKLIWQCGGLTRNVIPTPVCADGIFYATSGYTGNALLAIRLGREGDLTNTDAIAWKYGKNTPYVPSPLLYNGRLYIFATNNATLTCLDAKTGKVLIDAQKIDGLEGVYSSPVGANGRIYIVGRNGAAAVIKSSDTFELLATNRLDDHIDASPAVVGSELFFRGHKYILYRQQVRTSWCFGPSSCCLFCCPSGPPWPRPSRPENAAARLPG
jgi:outer membrane protein assembly factor BamB